MTFVLVKIIELDLHVNYYFDIIDLSGVCFFYSMLNITFFEFNVK